MDNPFKQLARPLIISLITDEESGGIVELMCEDIASSIARLSQDANAALTIVLDEEMLYVFKRRIEKYSEHSGIMFAYDIASLDSSDWQAQVARDFPPLQVGRFYIAGTHATQKAPTASIALRIDASAAFGTGEHETTSGCLLALEYLQKQRHFTRSLDMGCGTAILAIAMQLLWRKPVIAIDNDAVAVKVARTQIAQNQLRHYVRAYVGNGYHHRISKTQAPYDLIVANILARPLMKMAHSASKYLAPNGVLVLSGLLNHQEAMVLSAHRLQGLYLKKRLRRGKWSVLILAR